MSLPGPALSASPPRLMSAISRCKFEGCYARVPLLPPFIPSCSPFLPAVHCFAQTSFLMYVVKETEIILLDRIVKCSSLHLPFSAICVGIPSPTSRLPHRHRLCLREMTVSSSLARCLPRSFSSCGRFRLFACLTSDNSNFRFRRSNVALALLESRWWRAQAAPSWQPPLVSQIE